MVLLKGSTNKGQKVVAMYKRLTGYTLSDLYKSWSKAKDVAYDECRTMCINEGGFGFRVGSANSTQFTAGWIVCDKYDVIEVVRVETKDNSYKVYVNI